MVVWQDEKKRSETKGEEGENVEVEGEVVVC